jgi:phosphatidylserine/phosphatidylglycerophosphate/cardiolipin synthase-like enzyme
MRKRVVENGLTVHAIAGTHVVLLGLDLQDAQRPGCLGFAIRRTDHAEGETAWMRGMKTFEEIDPAPELGLSVSSRLHPFQSFQWADYSAKPGGRYTYAVIPLFGTPAALTEGPGAEVDVVTETMHDPAHVHAVFFNRGAAASQEYARRFSNRPPAEVGAQAYRWLSRGLEENIVKFIDQANGHDFGLCGAIYELQWPSVLQALRRAADADAQVDVVYDAIPGDGPKAKNELAIGAAGIRPLVHPRTKGTIMHNKFLVLKHRGTPVSVLTGSTNLTENGIFGHLNCAHVVNDPAVARLYADYWEQLLLDAGTAATQDAVDAQNPLPGLPLQHAITPVFSPRRGSEGPQLYADVAATAQQALFMTFAFGMHPAFRAVYDTDDDVLRYALMEKEGTGATLPADRAYIRQLRRRPNVVVALGNSLELNAFDRWLAELDSISTKTHVKWVHTKFMLVDPLGNTPTVVTGSANFSKAGMHANDENMLVIQGDTRVADIYLGEFMRLHTHYAFREAAQRFRRPESNAALEINYLVPDSSWQRDYFRPGHPRYLRRRYFAG